MTLFSSNFLNIGRFSASRVFDSKCTDNQLVCIFFYFEKYPITVKQFINSGRSICQGLKEIALDGSCESAIKVGPGTGRYRRGSAVGSKELSAPCRDS